MRAAACRRAASTGLAPKLTMHTHARAAAEGEHVLGRRCRSTRGLRRRRGAGARSREGARGTSRASTPAHAGLGLGRQLAVAGRLGQPRRAVAEAERRARRSSTGSALGIRRGPSGCGPSSPTPGRRAPRAAGPTPRAARAPRPGRCMSSRAARAAASVAARARRRPSSASSCLASTSIGALSGHVAPYRVLGQSVAAGVAHHVVVRQRPRRRRSDVARRCDGLVDRVLARRSIVPGRLEEVEVERLVVLVGPEVERQSGRVDPGLGDHHHVAVVGVEHGPPTAVDLVDAVAVPVRMVEAGGCSRAAVVIVVDVGIGRVLDQAVGDVDPEPVGAAVEPEPEDRRRTRRAPPRSPS